MGVCASCCALIILLHDFGAVGGSFAPFVLRQMPRLEAQQPARTPLKPCISSESRAGTRNSAHATSMHRNEIIAFDIGNDISETAFGDDRLRQYLSMMRPATIIQAVGAFLVGRLVIVSQQQLDQKVLPIIMASISIYLSYGAGMAMNDCADAVVDSRHATKQSRSIASKAVSVRAGWIFCFIVSVASIAFAGLAGSVSVDGHAPGFVGWTALNLILMAGYALGMQKLFLVKNVLCGFFAISPLVGASLLGDMRPLASGAAIKLYQLAAIGFPLQISREILKDMEDVEADRGEKRTLPLAIGLGNSKRIAYGIVSMVNGAMIFSPYYWRMFASRPPAYAISVALGTPMCIAASRLPLARGQRLLKKSIYVLLSGMISGLLLQ